MPYQAQGQEHTEKRIKGQTKTGPPMWQTGVIDEGVMDEVERAVPD